MRSHDLQREWESFRVEPGRDGDGGGADEICGRGEDVVQIHRQRVFGLRADRERGFGRGRGDEVIEGAERFLEFMAQFGADALGAAVVGVVVAGRQREGAEHDPAFHFGAESFAAGVEVDLVERARAFAAMSITNAVESRGSWPAMMPKTSAQSRTVFVTTPIWSRPDANATSPQRLTRP